MKIFKEGFRGSKARVKGSKIGLNPLRLGLKPDGTDRRTWTNSKDVFFTSQEVYDRIHLSEIPYKRNSKFFNGRDKALAATLYLTSGRINEVLRLKTNQIRYDSEDSRFLLIENFWISKRKKGKPNPQLMMPCPLTGELGKFTKLLLNHIAECKTERIFPISASRSWRIINTITSDPKNGVSGVWCHWFRGESLSWTINKLRNSLLVSELKGVVNAQTLKGYYVSGYREYADLLAGEGSVNTIPKQLLEDNTPLQVPSKVPVVVEPLPVKPEIVSLPEPELPVEAPDDVVLDELEIKIDKIKEEIVMAISQGKLVNLAKNNKTLEIYEGWRNELEELDDYYDLDDDGELPPLTEINKNIEKYTRLLAGIEKYKQVKANNSFKDKYTWTDGTTKTKKEFIEIYEKRLINLKEYEKKLRKYLRYKKEHDS